MGYWKSKVVPKIKKIFENKTSAAAANKSFDESKDEINKQFEERKTELQPKVLEIYGGLAPQIKALIKEPTEAEVKKNSSAIVKFLEDLSNSNIEFPGSKGIWEACAGSGSGSGLVRLWGPIIFIFEKVSTLIVDKDDEEGDTAAAAAPPQTGSANKEVEDELEKETPTPPTDAITTSSTPPPSSS